MIILQWHLVCLVDALSKWFVPPKWIDRRHTCAFALKLS